MRVEQIIWEKEVHWGLLGGKGLPREEGKIFP